MKKIDNQRKSAFIQRSDLELMLSLNFRNLLDIPEKLKVDFQKQVKGMNDYISHQFVEYKDLEVIEFLKKQDWILNYDIVNYNLSDFSVLCATIDRKIADLLELEEKYNAEYQNGDFKVKQIINKKLASLYKELIPLLYTQNTLKSPLLAEIFAGKIELKIPD